MGATAPLAHPPPPPPQIHPLIIHLVMLVLISLTCASEPFATLYVTEVA